MKELHEGRHEYKAACDKIDLVMRELTKLMAILESRAKDEGYSKRLDEMVRRIQSWGGTVGGTHYMRASTIYEQKLQALQAQTL